MVLRRAPRQQGVHGAESRLCRTIPDVDEHLLTLAFRKAYFARYFKYIYRVLAVMTFFYGAAYWEHLTTRTGVYITCFMLVSLVCYHYHRKWQVEEMN